MASRLSWVAVSAMALVLVTALALASVAWIAADGGEDDPDVEREPAGATQEPAPPPSGDPEPPAGEEDGAGDPPDTSAPAGRDADPSPYAAPDTPADAAGKGADGEDPGFEASAEPLPASVRDEMTGVSWHEDCPVGLDDLALLEITHHDFDGSTRTGEMVVAERVSDDVLGVLEDLYDAEYPIERMRRIDAYDGDDDASMEDNNSVAFNCRPVTGGQRWSDHAYGTAIDLNPVQNPYVRDATVLPPSGRAYLDRGHERTGMIVRSGPVVEAFDEIGWGWGGDWQNLDDYMHFSESGR